MKREERGGRKGREGKEGVRRYLDGVDSHDLVDLRAADRTHLIGIHDVFGSQI